MADVLRGSLFYSNTPEVRMHKLEGIRLIQQDIERGKNIPDGVILAVMSLTEEASEVLKRRSTRVELEAYQFKAPFFFMQW
jgi:hypothetical protein